MSGAKSRNKGHRYERKIRREFVKLGWEECNTSRYESWKMDDDKVDLVHTEPFNVQCKAQESGVNYEKLLTEMPEDSNYNVVFHKRNRRETITMSKDDFYALLQMLKQNGIF